MPEAILVLGYLSQDGICLNSCPLQPFGARLLVLKNGCIHLDYGLDMCVRGSSINHTVLAWAALGYFHCDQSITDQGQDKSSISSVAVQLRSGPISPSMKFNKLNK